MSIFADEGSWSGQQTQYVNIVLADTPIAYWSLDETTGTTLVDRIAARNLTAFNSPTLGALGSLNGSGAVILNGTNQYCQIAYNAALNPAAPFSLECWFRWDGGNPAGYGVITATIVASATTGYVIAKSNANLLYSAWGDGAAQRIRNGPTLVYGQWYYCVLVHTGTVGRFYVNGVQQGTDLANVYAPQVSLPLRIGANAYALSSFLNGAVDEVALYNYALTQAQISKHFNVRTGIGSDSFVIVKSSVPESGTGSDLALLRSVDSDSGTSTEFALLTTPSLPVSDSDSGTGTDAQSVIIQGAAQTGIDSGTGTELTLLTALLTVSDLGTGTDTQNVNVQGVAQAGIDSGVSTEFSLLTISQVSADTGTGIDAQAVIIQGAAQIVSDSGAGTETQAVRAVLSDADIGTDVDAVFLAASLAISDLGVSSDAQTISQIVIDYAVGTETQTLIAQATSVIGVDAGRGTDTQILFTSTPCYFIYAIGIDSGELVNASMTTTLVNGEILATSPYMVEMMQDVELLSAGLSPGTVISACKPVCCVR